jgi:adenosine deaminase
VGATRIGHGIHAYQDPSLIDHLVRHDILMEICPSSELDTGCVSSLSEIHLRDLMKAGVKIAIGADDTMVSATNLKREFDLLEKEYHLTDEEIITFWKNAIDHAFCDEQTKKTLRKKLSALLK